MMLHMPRAAAQSLYADVNLGWLCKVVWVARHKHIGDAFFDVDAARFLLGQLQHSRGKQVRRYTCLLLMCELCCLHTLRAARAGSRTVSQTCYATTCPGELRRHRYRVADMCVAARCRGCSEGD